MPFYTGGVNLNDFFFTDQNIVDQYIGMTLYTWGLDNSSGKLGDNTTVGRSLPGQTIAGGTNWKQVAGYTCSAGIKADGTLWLWGSNSYGTLGDGTVTSRSSPVQTITGGTNWSQVSCGYKGCGAIKTDGTLWMWGFNQFGALGNNSERNTGGNFSSPIQTITGGTNWSQVSRGNRFTGAIKTDGTLWLWGNNYYGQLGDNTGVARSSPVQTISRGTNWKQISCGYRHTAAIKTDGTLWTWGLNTYGELGDNTINGRASPVQTIAGGTNWSQVSCSGNNTAAIKTDGTLWVWGEGEWGQLGNGTNTRNSSPVQTLAGGTNWKQVESSGRTTAAIKTDGTLWFWGSNYNGQFSDGANPGTNSPVQSTIRSFIWKQIKMGPEGGNATPAIMAIRSDA